MSVAPGPLFVVDTNVVVSGLLTSEREAPTARILDAMLAGRLRFLLSEALLGEYRDVLLRPRIAARHGLASEEVDAILVELALHGVFRDLPTERGAERTDGHLFALLESAADALLVTGDLATLRRAGARGRTPRQLEAAGP